jgi:hypothetical protein
MEVDVPPNCVTPKVEPFQRIWAFVAKLLPVAISVKSGLPARTDVGAIEFRVGVLPEVLAEDHALIKLAASMLPSPVEGS